MSKPQGPTFGASDRGHLGDAAAGLVDGALSHEERDLALSHIANCEPCRIEVEQQRAIKALLATLPEPGPDAALMSRLLAIGVEPVRSERPTSRRVGSVPLYLPGRQRRILVGASALVAAGTVLIFAIGGTPPDSGAPVVPPVASLVDQHAATTVDSPFSDPGVNALTASYGK